MAVLFFSNALQKEIKDLPLNAKTKQMVMAQTVNLGNAKAPSIINSNDKVIVEKNYRDGFINAYQKIMRICTGLAFAGALMSFVFIKNNAVKKE